ncbi:MAG: PxKF domain-containing protein, partial [Methylomicrobium sp.]
NLTYTPAANANGSATITLTLSDDGGTANGGVDTSAPQTFTITVNAVNDVPSFTKGADQSVLVNAGAQTVTPWATNLSVGPANESGQTLNFIVSNDNNSLFSVQPSIAPDGTLTYTPALNAAGTATVTVQIHDDGGTANDGVDTSIAQKFTIEVRYSTGACLGSPGHQILQPIDNDQSSVFKLGSTVPTKFRVCDANGNSIGTSGVVKKYGLLASYGNPNVTVDELLYSTTPDTSFRWDPTAQQWIFNQATKNTKNPTLVAGTKYYWGIQLNDNSWIYFAYTLR